MAAIQKCWWKVVVLATVFLPSMGCAFLGQVQHATVMRKDISSFLDKRRARTQYQMCICIDCSRVTNCKAYHFVEEKHSQPHMTENPVSGSVPRVAVFLPLLINYHILTVFVQTFTPREGSPTIHVNIRTIRTDEDRKKEMQRMWSEHKEETRRAEKKAAAGGRNEPLHGDNKYDLSPVTTYEYDVVKCADYDHDPGCWVRNMPQVCIEIVLNV